MRKTLLQMTQGILSDMDSEAVNSLSDSEEAMQIASVIQDTYFNIVSARAIPEHDQLVKLEALSDDELPTYLRYPAQLKEIRLFEYNGREVYWKDPVKFLNDMPNEENDGVIEVIDPLSTTKLYMRNDKNPRYYTSFDDEYIVCDSYNAEEDDTLQASKTRCWGTVRPTFSLTDTFIPDLDEVLFPYLLAESKSVCFSLFKSGSDPKVEQAARRLKSYVQNDQFKTKRSPSRPLYGR
jgi:hypothetical protein